MNNSHLMSQLATQHVADLRRVAARSGAQRGSRPQQPSRARRRAGWALVTVGLRLAVGRPVGAL